MTRPRIWLITSLILFVGFLSIGVFKPTASFTTSFKVSRSLATTFRVLTNASNVGSFFEGESQIDPQIESDDKAGNRYLISYPDSDEAVEAELVGFDELKEFSFKTTSSSAITIITYSVTPDPKGTLVSVRLEIAPVSWWRRSLQPLIMGTQIERQDHINSDLARIVELSPESLIGEWVAVSKDGDEQLFKFKSDGTVDWKVSVDGNVFPLTNLYWKREASVRPESLDLSGFTTGPLRGLTLFGIVDMSRRDTLIFDAEAGLPDDDRIRPTTFTDSQLTYVRIR